jgi:ribonuclease HII
MLLSKFHGEHLEAGCDEAGRGCLAGPVFAAAVILPMDFNDPGLNDSKQLTIKERQRLRSILEKESVAWSVKMVGPEVIDELNILWASVKAMHLAISKLRIVPTFLLIDGNRFRSYPGIPHSCEVKGDSKFMSIAAASILAKTHRDEYMERLANFYPQYGWERNKGYPTEFHRIALSKYGETPEHRKSFSLRKTGIQGRLFDGE